MHIGALGTTKGLVTNSREVGSTKREAGGGGGHM